MVLFCKPQVVKTLLAVLDGKVECSGLEISDDNSKFLYKNVDTIRYKTRRYMSKAGDIIGR